VNVVCKTCAKSQNVCQCCLHDLTYGVPVAVRNAILKRHGGSVQFKAGSQVAVDYTTQKMASAAASGSHAGQRVSDGAHEELMRIKQARSRHGPDYSRNLPKFDTFDSKGENKRAAGENPYRTGPQPEHWIKDNKSLQDSIKDRFFGVDDKIADRMMNKMDGNGKAEALTPPADPGIVTLWLGGVTEAVSEAAIRDTFSKYGAVSRVSIKASASCAFVDFISRQAAEAAATTTGSRVTIEGTPLRVDWGKQVKGGPTPGGGPRSAAGSAASSMGAQEQQATRAAALAMGSVGGFPTPPTPSMPMPPPPSGARKGSAGVTRPPRQGAGGVSAVHYPSMDPGSMGARSEIA
jgi:pre-mRNA-splicing factor RBM22/SLT11